jgi:uncharacterized membrane protein
MFENLESATPDRYWLVRASLEAIVWGVGCFFAVFFLSLLITIPWSKHYWAGDGQAVLGGMAVSFYLALVCTIGAAIYIFRRAARSRRGVTPQSR